MIDDQRGAQGAPQPTRSPDATSPSGTSARRAPAAGLSGRPEASATDEQTARHLQELVARLRSVAESVSAGIPPQYRLEAFRLLGASLLARAGDAHPAGPSTEPPDLRQATARAAAEGHLDLAAYAPIFALPGRTLLKALATLEVGRRQLGVEWMTPAEIERFLTERARVRSVYRTNISNALRAARHLADRRRRGRGYEYSLTPRGQELLERERALLG